jgi:hypothetical protein
MERVCNGGRRVEKGIMDQTHNAVEKYWGKGGMMKWAEFLFSHAYCRNGTPTPSFIGQKDSYLVG